MIDARANAGRMSNVMAIAERSTAQGVACFSLQPGTALSVR